MSESNLFACAQGLDLILLYWLSIMFIFQITSKQYRTYLTEHLNKNCSNLDRKSLMNTRWTVRISFISQEVKVSVYIISSKRPNCYESSQRVSQESGRKFTKRFDPSLDEVKKNKESNNLSKWGGFSTGQRRKAFVICPWCWKYKDYSNERAATVSLLSVRPSSLANKILPPK